MLRPVPRSYPRHVAWCSLALLISVAACVPTAASAQWQTDDGGTWGARRCQSRNLISAGLVLGASGLPLLQNPEHAGIGIGVLLTGTAVAATGIGLRIRLGGDPGRAGEHDLWPEDRCQARSMSIRGGIYLLTAIITTVRLLRLPDDTGSPATRALVALMTIVPPGVIGLVFTALGLRRLRQLGPRPAPEMAESGEVTLMVGYPFTF